MPTDLKRSPDFRSIYANGLWLAASETEVRLLFIKNSPVDFHSEKDVSIGEAIRDVPFLESEIILSRPLAKWLRDSLDTFLKKTEGGQPK